MFGWRVAQTVEPGDVPLDSDPVGSDWKRMEDRNQNARKAIRHAGDHEDALVATNRR
jgi:hypothetical protein